MARRIIIGEILNLIKSIGGNPSKFMGTKSNINFLGKGPKETLFQGQLDVAGMMESGFPLERVITEAESAGGYAVANKLNDLQLQRLKDNLVQLKQAYRPEPVANITDLATGTGGLSGEGLGSLREGLKRFPEETHQFMGRPLKDADFAKIDRLVAEGKIPAAEGRLPEPGTAGVTAMLDQKTGMSRAIARQILQQDTRLNLPEEVLISLRTGSKGADPLDLMKKYYGESMLNFDKFLNSVNLEAGTPTELADMVLKHIKLTPQFAEGGLVDILSMNDGGRVGFKYGSRTIAKGALAFLNRNKKNAEYMFKASDNVSPGYAVGDMKYNAELLAEQLAEDAGVVYHDLDDLARIKFYGTAYDYLAKEMGMIRQMQTDVKNMVQIDALKKWDPTGRKPNASGGLAKILEV